jgi:hypothetical protein
MTSRNWLDTLSSPQVFKTTWLQYVNNHILLGNRCVLQQQHVDCIISDAILKKGTRQHADGWDATSKVWTHMVLHLPNTEGGFGVTFCDITKHTVFLYYYVPLCGLSCCLYPGVAGFVVTQGWPQGLIHMVLVPVGAPPWHPSTMTLINNYDYQDSAHCPTQTGVRAHPGRNSQNGVSQEQETTPLFLPKLNKLHLLFSSRFIDWK